VTIRLHNYPEVRAYLEKEHPNWLRALMPRHINAPAEYWPQKVLAISSAKATMQNYVSIQEHQTRPNPALTAVQGQAALLLRHDVPSYYVSRELLAAALRTELPDDMVFEAIPFPFNALVFMLPKGTVRHPTDGDCPFLALSRTSKGESLDLEIPGLDFRFAAEQNAVLVTTYMPEAKFNVKKYWRYERQMTRNLVEAYRFAVTFNHVSRAARLNTGVPSGSVNVLGCLVCRGT
jgi:hypothetical protein